VAMSPRFSPRDADLQRCRPPSGARLGLACAALAVWACRGPVDPGERSRQRFSPPLGSLHAEPGAAATDPTSLAWAKAAQGHPDIAEQRGEASWYGAELAGHKTANGERFDPDAMTAAHRTLPLGTWIEVRRLDIGRAVRVRINDRGPYAKGRILDLSRQAARLLDMLRDGVAPVEWRRVSGPL
jgi:rare lipoprotein A